jgi:hypothetical protein
MLIKKHLPPLFYWLKFACGAFSGIGGGGFDWRRAKGVAFAREASGKPALSAELAAVASIGGGQKAWFLPAGKWEAGAFSGGNGGPLCIR